MEIWRQANWQTSFFTVKLYLFNCGCTRYCNVLYPSFFIRLREVSPGSGTLFKKPTYVNDVIYIFGEWHFEIFFLFDKLQKEVLEKEKYKKAVLESRLDNLRNQINPHFLFNTFNALSELIEENPKHASDIIIELSDVYRYVLNTREQNWVALEEEINITRSFIEILKVRYESYLSVEVAIEPKYNNWFVPPMSVQMLIENAIKHNEISNEKNLDIKVFTESTFLVVSNNYQPGKVREGTNGKGLKNIRERYS